ncbi:MAG: two component, sigma54 specific, transcriptional regulator, Fis family [bacterium]|nr:two component, sigma54 specific, transcriptional regulator, Fis family [bacterium]
MAKVLVVDDDFDVRESLSDWLAGEHEVCKAAGVPEALVAVGRERPDVVVVDFELPPYRGDDFLATVAEHYPHVGRIMHTGSPGRALGFAYSIAHRVLKKGCDLTELSHAIRDFLGARH